MYDTLIDIYFYTSKPYSFFHKFNIKSGTIYTEKRYNTSIENYKSFKMQVDGRSSFNIK